MIPTPIRSALSTLHSHQVPCLLMGGQACVLYGGVEFSRDLDLVIAAHPAALTHLQAALAELAAEPIAVPPLRLEFLLLALAAAFPDRAMKTAAVRTLLGKALGGDREGLELELATEQIQGKAADRRYWAPLLAELEQMRWVHRRTGEQPE